MAVGLEEKRRFPRIQLKIPLRYQIRGGHDFDNSISDDISLGGLRFVNRKFIPPLTDVMLEINVLSRALNPIGRVAWSSPLPHSDWYNLGIEFIEMDAGEKNYLSDYIDMQLGKL